jgi:hypothetical protein
MRPMQGSGACLEVGLRYSLIGLRSSAGPRPRISFARVFKHFGHRAISPDLAFARRLDLHQSQLKRYPMKRLSAVPQFTEKRQIVERARLRSFSHRSDLGLSRSG